MRTQQNKAGRTHFANAQRRRATGALVVMLAGLAGLAWPFRPTSSAWHWTLDGPQALSGATVNADLVGVDANGAVLKERGDRPVSLISQPLSLPPTSASLVTVRAALPELPAGRRVMTRAVFLWQTEPGPSFRFSPQEVEMGLEPTEIRFGLEGAPSELHRIGVQFPDIRGLVHVQSMALPGQTIGERIESALSQLREREYLLNHSVNFIRGPTMLGYGLNYFLLALVALIGGGAAFASLVRRKRVNGRTIAGVALVLWLAADAVATVNFARQVREESRVLRTLVGPAMVAATEGDDVAWASVALRERTPKGSTFTVVSDDPFSPSHRLAYHAAPQRTLRPVYQAADYIVVMGASDVTFEPLSGSFQRAGGPTITAELVDAHSNRLYLLRRIQP